MRGSVVKGLVSVGLAVAAIIGPGMTAHAAVPPLLNFQGILLDDALGTVVDSTYDLTFRIYDDSIGGMVKWEENQTVKTENGLFNTFLGKSVPLPDSVFNGDSRFFEIELIGVGPYAPRNRIGSVAYAYRVQSVDGATGGSIYGDIQLHSNLTVGDDAGAPGKLSVTDGSVPVFATEGSSGATALTGTGSSVVFDMSASGDVSVMLPDNAVSASEQLDEAGLASDGNNTIVTLPQGSTTMTDLATVTITIPTDGYIFVQGRSTFTPDFDPPGWTGRNKVYVQIDETASGPVETSQATELGLTSYFNFGSHRLAQTAYADRIYFKAAGTYTFRLEARAFTSNSSGAISDMNNSLITAMFFPTSYGAVKTLVSTGGASGFSDAEQVTVTPSPDGDAGELGSVAYRVDLRELELNAARLKFEAERAQKELLEAKLKLQLER